MYFPLLAPMRPIRLVAPVGLPLVNHVRLRAMILTAHRRTEHVAKSSATGIDNASSVTPWQNQRSNKRNCDDASHNIEKP